MKKPERKPRARAKQPRGKNPPKAAKPYVIPKHEKDPRRFDNLEIKKGRRLPPDQSLGIPPGIPISEWPQQT